MHKTVLIFLLPHHQPQLRVLFTRSKQQFKVVHSTQGRETLTNNSFTKGTSFTALKSIDPSLEYASNNDLAVCSDVSSRSAHKTNGSWLHLLFLMMPVDGNDVSPMLFRYTGANPCAVQRIDMKIGSFMIGGDLECPSSCNL